MQVRGVVQEVHWRGLLVRRREVPTSQHRNIAAELGTVSCLQTTPRATPCQAHGVVSRTRALPTIHTPPPVALMADLVRFKKVRHLSITELKVNKNEFRR